jgi:hypothetical protein
MTPKRLDFPVTHGFRRREASFAAHPKYAAPFPRSGLAGVGEAAQ